jgi:hypothetical protein
LDPLPQVGVDDRLVLAGVQFASEPDETRDRRAREQAGARLQNGVPPTTVPFRLHLFVVHPRLVNSVV